MPSAIQLWYDKLKIRLGYGNSLALVPPERLEEHYGRALSLLARRVGSAGIGDYVEFGVYAGASMASMHRALIRNHLPKVRLIGFDSFEGLPRIAAAESRGRWRPGQFKSDVALTRLNLSRHGVPLERVALVPGWYADTATVATAIALQLKEISVLLIDCDLYSSAVTALSFCAPYLSAVSIVFFDEWSVSGPGEHGLDERRAFEEFLAAHPEFKVEEVGDLGRYKDESRGFVLTRVQPGSGS